MTSGHNLTADSSTRAETHCSETTLQHSKQDWLQGQASIFTTFQCRSLLAAWISAENDLLSLNNSMHCTFTADKVCCSPMPKQDQLRCAPVWCFVPDFSLEVKDQLWASRLRSADRSLVCFTKPQASNAAAAGSKARKYHRCSSAPLCETLSGTFFREF